MKNAITNEHTAAILDHYKRAPSYDIDTRELIPPELMVLMPSTTEIVDDGDPFCVLRLFHPSLGSEWLVAAAEQTEDDTLLYARVKFENDDVNAEWEEVSYRDLNDLNRRGGNPEPWPGRIEVDLTFEPALFSEIRRAVE